MVNAGAPRPFLFGWEGNEASTLSPANNKVHGEMASALAALFPRRGAALGLSLIHS